MESDIQSKATLITGVIGDDVHITGIRILERALKEAGFKVISLGIQVSQEDFIRAALEAKADAILVSSLGGHAKLLSKGLKEKCLEAGLNDIRLYIGGNLSIGEAWEDVENVFRELGFDRAYPPFTLPKPVIEDLEADLVKQG